MRPPRALTRGSDDLLRLALFYPVVPVAHALAPSLGAQAPDILSAGVHRELLAATEHAGFEYVFMADVWASYGPESEAKGINNPSLPALMMAGFASAVTSRIGIISTGHLAYLPPAVLARWGAGLDAISGGRWGLNIVSGGGYADGLLPEPARSLAHDERYELAEESIGLVRRLWSGEKVEHEGKYFNISGGLLGPRPVQEGGPMLVSAGASDAGLALAARHADCLFVPSALSAEGVTAIRERLDPHLERAGRARRDVSLQVNPVVILRDTDDEAEEAAATIRAAVDLDVAREHGRTMAGFSETYRKLYENGGTEDEDALRDRGWSSGTRRIVGSPETVAQAFVELHASGIRGAAINFLDWSPETIQRFSKTVMPLLHEAGVWTRPQARGWSW